MTHRAKVINVILGVISYFMGAVYCATLIGIPIGFMCFISARRFMSWSELADVSLVAMKDLITKWTIFISIFAFPIGLISIINLFLIGNNATVSDTNKEDESVYQFTTTESGETVVQETEKKEVSENELSALETIEKLQHLKEEGLITEEEFERAKNEVIKSNEN